MLFILFFVLVAYIFAIIYAAFVNVLVTELKSECNAPLFYLFKFKSYYYSKRLNNFVPVFIILVNVLQPFQTFEDVLNLKY